MATADSYKPIVDDSSDMPSPWALTHAVDRGRAIALLGAASTSQLSKKTRAELISLLGA